jgi:hypothetical protein
MFSLISATFSLAGREGGIKKISLCAFEPTHTAQLSDSCADLSSQNSEMPHPSRKGTGLRPQAVKSSLELPIEETSHKIDLYKFED